MTLPCRREACYYKEELLFLHYKMKIKMKNIGKIIFFILMGCFVFIALPVQAETAAPELPRFPYTLSAISSLGLIYGQAEEIVYKYPDSEAYLSQLIWNMKPLFYAASSLKFSRTDPRERISFFSRLTLKIGIPYKTGSVEDRDWMGTDHQDLTHFSFHNNHTQGSLFLDFSAGITFPFRRGLLLNVYGTFVYMSFSWAARDGYFQYSPETAEGYQPWDESIPKQNAFGAVILYSQKWMILTPGVSLYLPLFSFLGAEFSLQGSPIIFCTAEDDHLMRGIQFTDNISQGIYFEPRGKLVFFPYKKIGFSLHISYRILKGRGQTDSRSASHTESARLSDYDDAGAAYSALDAGLSFTIRF
jgi:outer membrane protease